ncbi:unnamed protein product [Effrenium voratum]|nr:unnamed protein product [Effrenium voratum]
MWTPVKSTGADVCGFVSPVALALLVVVATRRLGADEAPLLWKLLLEVLVDVAHVYGTLCRTVLDSEATALNWRLYLLAVPGLLLPTLFVNIVFGTWLGWSLLSYYAMFHFAKQPFGLLCIYKARQGERDPKEHQLDYWTCLAGAGLPLLQWHAGDFPDFAWFGGEDEKKLFQLPAVLLGPLRALHVLVPGVWLSFYLWRWLRGGRLNLGKLWIMVATYFTWYMGMCGHHVRSLAFINLFHGMSSSFLVYHVVRQRYSLWEAKNPQTMHWIDDHFNCVLVSTPVFYTCFLCGLACGEDLAWDILIHQDYMRPPVAPLEGLGRQVAVSCLMLPQLAHYFLALRTRG